MVTKTKDGGRWALGSCAEAQALAQRGERLRAGVFCLLVRLLQRLLQRRRRMRRVRLVHKFSVSMLLLLLLLLLAHVLARLSVPVPVALAMMQASRGGHWPRRLRAVEWPRSVRERRERRECCSARGRAGPT